MWRNVQKFLATFLPSLLLLLFVGVLVCRLNQWDSMVAVTLVPFWAWATFGMIASLLTWIICRGVPAVVIFSVWFLAGIVIPEESHGLFRELIHTIDPKNPPPDDEVLRVVNVNANGTVEALSAVLELEPDILIVQHPPGKPDLAETVRALYGMDGMLLAGTNHAILARGEFIDTISDPNASSIHARLRIPNDFLIDITSLELAPLLPRFSLWNPETWETLSWTRMQNRRQLRTHFGENEITRPNTARLVSGGFQTPPGDDVFHPLVANEMTDAFSVSGEGWGNTYPANYSYIRLDQIWVSDNLRPLRTTTRINPHSDHRTVIADLQLIAETE